MRARSSEMLAAAIVGLTLMGAARAGSAQEQGDAAVADQSEPTQLVVIAPRGGIGGFNESTVDQEQNVWSAGLSVGWRPDEASRLVGQGMVGGYMRDYVQSGLGQPGQPPRVEEDELRWDGNLHYGYNVLLETPVDGWIYLGWRHLYFVNDRFSYSLSGAMVGAQIDWPILDDFAFLVGADYTFNIVGIADPVDDTGLSVTGEPLASLRFGAGVRADVSHYVQLGLAYEGEHVPYDHTDLLFHQVVLEVGVPIRF